MANNISNNNMGQVRDALFSQLARLQDTNLPLEKEISRAQAIVEVTNQLIQTARVEIEFVKVTGMMAENATIAPGEQQKKIGHGK